MTANLRAPCHPHRARRPSRRLRPALGAALVGLGLLLAVQAAPAASLWLTGPDGAVISIEGREVGRLPLATPLDLAPGQYRLHCELPGHEPHEEAVRLESETAWLRVRIRLAPYSRRSAVLSNLLLAGLGQQYLGRRTSGWLFTAAELGGVLTAISGELSFQNHRDDYLVLMQAYREALILEDVQAFRAAAADAFAKMEDAESRRNTGLWLAAGAVAVSMLDAWLRFPGLEVGAGELPADQLGDAPSAPVRADGNALTGGQATIRLGWRTRF